MYIAIRAVLVTPFMLLEAALRVTLSRSSACSHSLPTLGRRTASAPASSGLSTPGAPSRHVAQPPCFQRILKSFCARMACDASVFALVVMTVRFMTLTIYHPVGTAKMGVAGGEQDTRYMRDACNANDNSLCLMRTELSLIPESRVTRQIPPPLSTSACACWELSGCVSSTPPLCRL